MLSVFMLNVTNKPLILSVIAECHYAECHGVTFFVMLMVVRLDVMAL
jgi:hypothetical protein